MSYSLVGLMLDNICFAIGGRVYLLSLRVCVCVRACVRACVRV